MTINELAATAARRIDKGGLDPMIIAEAIREAVLAETGRCAKVARDWAAGAGTVNDAEGRPLNWWADGETAGHDIAEAILQRSEP